MSSVIFNGVPDRFDTALDSVCSVWKKGAGVIDGYGIESQVFVLVVEGIACRVDYGAGDELNTDVAFGEQHATFFMRPLEVEDPPVRLNIHHWLQINVENGRAVADPSADGVMYDIRNVKNFAWHHFEVQARLLVP